MACLSSRRGSAASQPSLAGDGCVGRCFALVRLTMHGPDSRVAVASSVSSSAPLHALKTSSTRQGEAPAGRSPAPRRLPACARPRARAACHLRRPRGRFWRCSCCRWRSGRGWPCTSGRIAVGPRPPCGSNAPWRLVVLWRWCAKLGGAGATGCGDEMGASAHSRPASRHAHWRRRECRAI